MLNNDALLIAIQCGVASIAWGSTGVAKSAFLEALACYLGYKFYCFIPSQHMPEDIGGIPDIDKKSGHVRMVYLEWLMEMAKPNMMLMLDELTTAPNAMRPGMLSILNERRVGRLTFHPSSIVVAAANPPEMAPNGADLEASLCNRLYHHDWVTPTDSWLEGMIAGGKFSVPSRIPVVGTIDAYLPKWCGIIGRMLQRHPGIRETTRIPDGQRAFPSPRQWYNTARCLAGADKVGMLDEVADQLTSGLVGDDAAGVLAEWLAARSLYDAAAVVDGTAKVDYSDDRIDQLIYLPVGILETLEDDHDDSRITRAIEVLVDMGENGMLDRVMPVLSEITAKYESYRTPKKLQARYGAIVGQTMAG